MVGTVKLVDCTWGVMPKLGELSEKSCFIYIII